MAYSSPYGSVYGGATSRKKKQKKDKNAELLALAQELGLSEKVEEPKENFLTKLGKIVDAPRQALTNAYSYATGSGRTKDDKSIFDAMGKGFTGTREVNIADILEDSGMGDETLFKMPVTGKDISARDIAGFAGDVVLDPLNLVGIGVAGKAAKLAKVAGEGGQATVHLNKAGRALQKSHIEDAIKKVGAKGDDIKKVEEEARQAFAKRLRSNPDELKGLEDLGGIKFASQTLVKGKNIAKGAKALEAIPVAGKVVKGAREGADELGDLFHKGLKAKRAGGEEAVDTLSLHKSGINAAHDVGQRMTKDFYKLINEFKPKGMKTEEAAQALRIAREAPDMTQDWMTEPLSQFGKQMDDLAKEDQVIADALGLTDDWYRENYFPHVFKNDKDEVDDIISKFVTANGLKNDPGFLKHRSFDGTLEDIVQFAKKEGVELKPVDAAEAMGARTRMSMMARQKLETTEALKRLGVNTDVQDISKASDQTFDDFMRGKTPLYHGTTKEFPLGDKDVLSFDANKGRAEEYARSGGTLSRGEMVKEIDEDGTTFLTAKNPVVEERFFPEERVFNLSHTRKDGFYVDPDAANKANNEFVSILRDIKDSGKRLTKDQSNNLDALIKRTAKEGFDWTYTKNDPTRLMRDVIYPSLKERGYGAIKYSDDAGETTAVFDKGLLKTRDELKEQFEISQKIAAQTNPEMKGYREVPDIPELKGYKFPPDVAKFIHKEMTKTGKPPNDFLKSLDIAMGAWKVGVTSLPTSMVAFHSRNLIGNKFNKWLGGFYNAPLKAGKIEKKVATEFAKNVKDINKVKFVDDFGVEWTAEKLRKAGIMGGQAENELNAANKVLNAISKPGRKVGQFVEDPDRVSFFLQQRAMGKSVEEAAAHVNKYLFNYGNQTDLVQKVGKVVPFFTWTANNIPLQVEQLLKQPHKFNKVANLYQSSFSPEEQENLPDYVKEGIFLEGEQKTNDEGDIIQTVIRNLGLPVEDLARLNRGSAGRTFEREILGSLGPGIKQAAELATGRDFFRGEDIEDINSQYAFGVSNYPDEIKALLGYKETDGGQMADGTTFKNRSVDAEMIKLIDALGLSRAMNTLFPSSGDSSNPLENLDEVGTKAALPFANSEYNMTDEKKKREREMLERITKLLVEEGKLREYTNYYQPKDDKKKTTANR